MAPIIKIIKFFDRLEDRIRSALSHLPVLYALIGGVGIVLFWRGVWHTTDYISAVAPAIFGRQSWDSIEVGPWWDGPVSLVISITILLMVGLFVSAFIGDTLILSGLKKDKKLVEKTESEVETESDVLHSIQDQVDEIEKDVEELKNNHNHS